MEPIFGEFAIIGNDLSIMENVRILLDDKNRIIEIEECNRDVDNNIALIPGLFNAHVHAADIELRGVGSRKLDELVGKHGIKHKYLSQMTESQLQTSLELAYQEAVRSGTLGWSDFREGGLKGIKPYPLNQSKFHLAFGRPHQNEFNDLSLFPNIGIMDVKAYSDTEMNKISENLNRKSQKLFIHASESMYLRQNWILKHGISDIQWSIDVLNPDALIHVTHADESDITEMSKSKTGAVICLRSNKFTNAGVPPIKALIESDIILGIGTDNAMFNNLSVWNELSSLKNLIDPDRLLSMATIEGALLCGVEWGVNKGNSNFLEFHLPNHIQVKDLKKWIVNNGTEKNILKIWR